MVENATDEELPWLGLEYVSKILTKHTGSPNISIKSFTKQPATEKGENYVSAIHSLKVEYDITSEATIPQSVSFIVKSRVENDLISAIEQEFNIFQRETQFYEVIMMAAEQLLQSIDDDTHFGPRPIYVDERVIVLENLKCKGYQIGDIQTGLNYAQAKLVVKKLAKFHATTMVLYRKHPEFFKHHLAGNMSENPTPLHDVYTNCIKSTIEYCETNSELRIYVPRLKEFEAVILPNLISVFSRSPTDHFHVLNHGDMWVNNLLFNDKQDVLLIDYQEGYFGSPGIDWNWFMFSSWPTNLFLNHKDDLIALYHEVLTETLKRLSFDQKIPTLRDISEEIISKGKHGVATAVCILPVLLNKHPELADPENFVMDSEEHAESRRVIFNNSAFAERLSVFLKHFTDTGIL